MEWFGEIWRSKREEKNQMAVVLWIWITVVCIIASVLMSSEAANGRELNRISFHWTQIDWFFFVTSSLLYTQPLLTLQLPFVYKLISGFLFFFCISFLLFYFLLPQTILTIFHCSQNNTRPKVEKKEKRNHYRNFYLKCYAVDTWLYLLDALALI